MAIIVDANNGAPDKHSLHDLPRPCDSKQCSLLARYIDVKPRLENDPVEKEKI